ncbi:hypothetical protein BKA62DRAFT_624407 [Auriculariales sp. MPI-PUGE-AT-0066]|nr:hypothetical protein BKA62DRAFT_624407 [Auriculariales sp. MPI-PUGE-AT-0066]
MTNRLYSEIHTGNLWAEHQRKAPPGVTILPLIIGSDATHVTNFSGDGKMHPVYISSGHIHAAIRNQPSQHAFILVGYIPVCKFTHTEFTKQERRGTLPGRLQARLFHHCMKIIFQKTQLASKTPVPMVDCYGQLRKELIHPIINIADREEHHLTACLAHNCCFSCEAVQQQFGDPEACEPLTCSFYISLR